MSWHLNYSIVSKAQSVSSSLRARAWTITALFSGVTHVPGARWTVSWRPGPGSHHAHWMCCDWGCSDRMTSCVMPPFSGLVQIITVSTVNIVILLVMSSELLLWHLTNLLIKASPNPSWPFWFNSILSKGTREQLVDAFLHECVDPVSFIMSAQILSHGGWWDGEERCDVIRGTVTLPINDPGKFNEEKASLLIACS